MSDESKGILISIADPVGMVKHAFVMNGHYEYDTRDFFASLLNDMFNGVTTEVPLSTNVLVKEGMEEDEAKELAYQVFIAVVATISSFIPDANFDEDRYRYQLHGEYDIYVSPGNNNLLNLKTKILDKVSDAKTAGEVANGVSKFLENWCKNVGIPRAFKPLGISPADPRNFGLDYDGDIDKNGNLFIKGIEQLRERSVKLRNSGMFGHHPGEKEFNVPIKHKYFPAMRDNIDDQKTLVEMSNLLKYASEMKSK
jgi:hypothetical protein